MPGRRIPSLLIFLFFVIWAGPAWAEQPADLVFHGGSVYTMNEAQPWAEAVAVVDGRILYVGDGSGLTRHIGADTEAIDLDGRMLMPGFIDSHNHPMAAGTRYLRCQLHDLSWPEELLEKIAECTRNAADGEWVRGVSLDGGLLEGAGPGRALLDEVTKGHAAIMAPRFTRAIWVNSEALRQAGIDAGTPDPEHGVIERDEHGEPTGVLRGEAISDVWRLSSHYTAEEFRDGLRLASAMANRFGITTSSEAQAFSRQWSAMLEAERAGELTLRLNASLNWDWQKGPEQIDDLQRMRDAVKGPLMRVIAVKMGVDGGMMGETAAVQEPYVGTDNRGTLYHGENLAPRVVLLDAAGFDVHLHAYGDAAVRDGLDAIEAAINANPDRVRRHHMAHIALIDSGDLPRFAELGVIADIQPLWASLDEHRMQVLAALGPERAKRYLPFRSIMDSGALVVAGSDWISDSMNPLYGIQVAVTRRPPDGSGPAWLPDQRVTLEEMLRAYTLNGAKAAGLGDITGSIEVGKAADLIVLELNLFEVDPMALQGVEVLLTLLEGREVHRAEGFN